MRDAALKRRSTRFSAHGLSRFHLHDLGSAWAEMLLQVIGASLQHGKGPEVHRDDGLGFSSLQA